MTCNGGSKSQGDAAIELVEATAELSRTYMDAESLTQMPFWKTESLTLTEQTADAFLKACERANDALDEWKRRREVRSEDTDPGER